MPRTVRAAGLVTPALLTLLLAAPAFAHTGASAAAGFGHGFAHPLQGFDHLLAMVTVGVWAVSLGGGAVGLVPAAFVALMALGGALGAAGVGLPGVEAMIVGSVVALGALVAFRAKPPTTLAAAVVGLFALSHGHAHGAEMPLGADGALYGLGFVAATALLHAAGVGFGLLAGRALPGAWLRVSGAAVAAAGLLLAVA